MSHLSQDEVNFNLMLFKLYFAIYYIVNVAKRVFSFLFKYQIPILVFIFIFLFFVKKVDIKKLKLSDTIVAIPLIVLLITPCYTLYKYFYLRNFGRIYKEERVEIMRKNFIDHGNFPPDLPPAIYGLSEPLFKIFSVPKKNSVGTTDINNAITNLTFQEDKMQGAVQKKDFLEYVSGGAQYHTVINDEYIGYSQERRFILFNYKDNSFRKYVITTDGDEYVSKFQVLDWNKRLFVFEVLQTWEHYHKKFIRIFYLNDEEQKLIKEGEFGTTLNNSYKWQVYNNHIFFHYYKLVEAYDAHLNKITHPLVEYIHENKKKFNFIRELVIHSTLPFAVILDSTVPLDSKETSNSKLWVIRWEHPDKDEMLIPFFPYNKSIIKPHLRYIFILNVQFSPDGRWLVLYDQSDYRNSDSFVAIPVEPDDPKFFGTPKLLGKNYYNREEHSTTWIESPLSFVACYGETLYKWELDKLLNSDENDEGEIEGSAED